MWRILLMLLCLSIISQDALAACEKDDASSPTPKQASVAQATKACLAAAAHAAEHESAEQAFNEAVGAATGGPSRAVLEGVGTVRLPEKQLLVPEQPAIRMLRAIERTVPSGTIGLLIDPAGVDGVGLVRFVVAGFVDADVIADWTPNDLLYSLNDLMAQANTERAEAHLPPMVARRWVVPPRYDRARHTLSWAALMVPKSASADADGEVTYRAVAFGRDGYLELSFVTSTQDVPDRAQTADDFLAGVQFGSGRAYGDVTASDPKAAGGLATVMGVKSFRRAVPAQSFWYSDRVIPAAGGFVGSVGAVALGIHVRRILRRRSRRI